MFKCRKNCRHCRQVPSGKPEPLKPALFYMHYSATTSSPSRDPPHVFLLSLPSPALLPYIGPSSRISPLSLAVLPKYTEPRAVVKDGLIPLCQLYLMHRSHPALKNLVFLPKNIRIKSFLYKYTFFNIFV